MSARASARLLTPLGQAGVAVIQIQGDIDWALDRIGAPALAAGRAAPRRLLDIDDGLLARVGERTLLLTPHGGVRIVRVLLDALAARGVAVAPEAVSAQETYPEAEDDVEALMLAALAQAASPLAVDLLLEQPSRWSAWDGAAPSLEAIDRVSRVLNRLIDRATVVMVGRPNVGKSTLTNALARRAVSIVAEEAGATRDHVGVTLDLAGLVVRWIDTAGVDALSDATPAAREAIDVAAVLVLAGDAASGFPDLDGLDLTDRPIIRVETRADLLSGLAGVDVSTAAGAEGGPIGLDHLARVVREAVLPASAIGFEGPWRFDAALPLEDADVAGGGRRS